MRKTVSLQVAAFFVLAFVLDRRRLVVQAKTLERDVFALIAFYQEVKGRSNEWRGVMNNWPVHTCSVNGTCGIDPCGFEFTEHPPWHGVTCRYQYHWDRSIPRVVTNIHLPKLSLSGPLPRSFSYFANITEIDMDTNQLTGALPAEWGCLRNLIEIDLSKNMLQGSIPAEWGLLSGLVEMEVDGNRALSGCVPEGAPPFNQWCGPILGRPCPSFTTDRLIGTDVGGTRIRSRCDPTPGGLAALEKGLRCPNIAEARDSILEYFFSRKGKTTATAPTGAGTAVSGARPASSQTSGGQFSAQGSDAPAK